MRITYEHELQELKKELKEMARRVEAAIDQTFVAFESDNRAMAEEIIRGDRNINDMERAIESRCLSLILKQTPVAGDLRMVSTALKVVTDLERIGDHASDIAELILRIHGKDTFKMLDHLPTMAAKANDMLHDAIEAFIAQDDGASDEIIRKDDEVDELFNQTKKEVAEMLKGSSEDDNIDNAIDLLMISKYLERIADHAVNICEWTQFSKTGAVKNVRIL
ncbi:MAG TPA: phosphate signaling complex protein PhoU [Candidatus Cottocaccamicrobium excrementipullorum]|nr:phosphate signaling complex protein PhoU [Candidatus Cottocaccamicrobium excrementipullorum]